ncbi:hypothetical protein [Nostoc sp.]|uniref:hypothetical protein n=1 Tax=Nostoc sp. TaxID=1180 RepID=UPI002FFCDC54
MAIYPKFISAALSASAIQFSKIEVGQSGMIVKTTTQYPVVFAIASPLSDRILYFCETV